jgi:hypothetical protein
MTELKDQLVFCTAESNFIGSLVFSSEIISQTSREFGRITLTQKWRKLLFNRKIWKEMKLVHPTFRLVFFEQRMKQKLVIYVFGGEFILK